MPTRTTLTAAATGFVSGLCLAALTVDDVRAHGMARLVLATVVIGFFPTVVVTLAVLCVARRWMARHEVRSRRDAEALAGQRRQMSEEFDRRSAELREREARVNRHSALNQGQYRTLVDQLHEARAERDAAVQERDALQGDFDVLVGEYNGMILGEVDERAAQFNRPHRPKRSAGRERLRARAVGEAVQVPRIGRQAEPEQHARPAEG